MLQYVDVFSCSLNEESEALVIHFSQKEPIIEDNGNVHQIINPVTSIILQKNSAIALLSILQQVYGNNPVLEDNSSSTPT